MAETKEQINHARQLSIDAFWRAFVDVRVLFCIIGAGAIAYVALGE